VIRRAWIAALAALLRYLHRIVADVRNPDFVIGGRDDPYLCRWFLTPWSGNKRGIAKLLPNVYLHLFLRSDADFALHDHPWANLSILLDGTYVEHTIRNGGVHIRTRRFAGDMKARRASAAHRIEIVAPCWSLFLTGPTVRDWGFHCPQGWRHWKDFVDEADSGAIGNGCE
jgi:hypothetical protein